jgi:Tfp pilus assembly protein PilF
MKPASTLALVLLAACAARANRPAEPLRPRPELVAVSRALAELAAAERKGDVAALRQRWSQSAQGAPSDATARFLAVSAQPPDEHRWSAFRDLARELPESALGQLGMARTYVEWNTLDQADRAIDAALELEPDNWLAVLSRAEVSERRERLDAARADYRTVLSADPGSPEAHLGLARIAWRTGDAAGAEAEAAAALKGDPGLFGALALLGELATKAGDLSAAAGAWAGAVEAAPRDRDARVTLATVLGKKGDAAGSRDQWKAALLLREDADGLVALAGAARACGDAATEGRALERLSQLDPSAAEWRRIAELRLASGDADGAEKALRRALARDPRDAAANLLLARARVARGETAEALEAYRAAGDAAGADRAALEARLNLERLARPDVTALQRAVQDLVDRTYRARLAASPALAGLLRLRVTVDDAGGASLVEVLEDTMQDADVRACAYWNLRDASYPPKKPGRYAFTFAFGR